MATKKDSAILGYINRSIVSKSCEELVSQAHAVLVPFIWHYALKTDDDKLEQVQKRATRMIRGFETKLYEERLKQLGIFSLEKRRLRKMS